MKKSVQNTSFKSMSPLISPEDKVIVEKKRSLNVDDIIAISKEDKIIAHRLVYISPNKDYLITKGDNNRLSDGKIKFENVLGKVEKLKKGKNTVNIEHSYLLQSSIYLEELKEIASAFTKSKISYVILKGLPTYLYFLKSPPRRFYLDIDILVKKNHAKKALKILENLGFKKVPGTLFGKVVKKSTEANMFKFTPPYATRVDFHTDPGITFTKVYSFNKLLPQLKDFPTYLFENKKIVPIDKTKYPILNLETQIIYTLLHFYHHNFQGTHRIIFISKLLSLGRINWDKTSFIIKEFELENLIYPSILILNKYYKFHIPNKFEEKIRPKTLKRFYSKLISFFVSPFESGTRAQEGAKRFIFILLLSNASIVEKLKVIFSKDFKNYLPPTIMSLMRSASRKVFKSSMA